MEIGYEVFHPNLAVLVGFYVEVLGFQGPQRTDGIDHVVVSRGQVRVGCTLSPDADAHPPSRWPPAGSEIVLRVKDVNAEYDRVIETGWPLADPLMKRPWGLTDFRVFDPTGQYLRISSQR